MDAERAHHAGEMALRVPLVWLPAKIGTHIGDPALKTEVAGLSLPSPLGMAAGFDKECRVIKPLLNLGFGFASAGTVTLARRPGNPQPRVLRLSDRRALLNSLGFPGPGLEVAEKRLSRLKKVRDRLFVSIAGTIEDEIVECHRRLQPLSAAIELNISSPNTAGLRVFHEPGRLRVLVEALAQQKSVPLFVKLQPWSREDESRREALKLAETSILAGADGLIVANTHPVEHDALSMHRGGLSGAPLKEHTARMVAEAKSLIGGDGDVIACGGISSAADLWHMLALGASAAQLYTAFIYQGPGLPGKINRDLLKLMRREGIRSVKEIAGLPPV